MNILPKKRWHVRTKDNIARVRKDEALAAEEEKKKQIRIQTAEREARTDALRKKAREQYGSHTPASCNESLNAQGETYFSSDRHVNLFYELEHNELVSNKPNEEHEKERQLEKEKYEKQIGYLVYLGQDTNELTGNVSWYNKLDRKNKDENSEICKRQKNFEDPLTGIRKYLKSDGIKKIMKSVEVEIKSKEEIKRKDTVSKSSWSNRKKFQNSSRSKKKKKKHRKHKKERSQKYDSSAELTPDKKKIDLEQLRKERLRRELKEKQRADELFSKLNSVNIKKEKSPIIEYCQKYNSQFNPHLARQNLM